MQIIKTADLTIFFNYKVVSLNRTFLWKKSEKNRSKNQIWILTHTCYNSLRHFIFTWNLKFVFTKNQSTSKYICFSPYLWRFYPTPGSYLLLKLCRVCLCKGLPVKSCCRDVLRKSNIVMLYSWSHSAIL